MFGLPVGIPGLPRAGQFAFAVGVDRVGQAEELLEHGADIVVKDLAEHID